MLKFQRNGRKPEIIRICFVSPLRCSSVAPNEKNNPCTQGSHVAVQCSNIDWQFSRSNLQLAIQSFLKEVPELRCIYVKIWFPLSRTESSNSTTCQKGRKELLLDRLTTDCEILGIEELKSLYQETRFKNWDRKDRVWTFFQKVLQILLYEKFLD